MRKFKKIIVLLAILVLTYSCTSEEQEIEVKQNDTSELSNRNPVSRRNYSSNSLVIKYVDGLSEIDKQYLRDFYQVENYKLCSHCSDQSIELWLFDDSILIEPKKNTIDDPTGGMNSIPFPYDGYIQEVDFNFIVYADDVNSTTNSSSAASTLQSYESYIKSTNDGVTIAVFDTGINPFAGDATPLFANQFLYNATNDGVQGVFSGWDFVNQDDDCFDDHYGSHGTAVTSIISNILQNQYGVPYQIMPLKIFDSEGKSNYFNFLCALNYALERRANILQMSMGWYDNSSGDLVDNIFTLLMNQYPNTVLVCSAGNEGSNNDTNIHCPSGYPQENIISVASCNQYAVQQSPSSIPNISYFSNYGASSVDFFANGEDISFLGDTIEGTSFAAPKVTAIVAKFKFLYPSMTNDELIQALLSYGIACQDTFELNRPVKYNKILIP